MTLNEYKKQLDEFCKNNSRLGNCIVVTSIDNEGNGFNEVFYGPTAGYYTDGEFIDEGDDGDINAVCLN